MEGLGLGRQSHGIRIHSGGALVCMLVIGFASIACSAQKPVLYPNKVVQAVGPDQVETDMALCAELADQYG